MRKEGYRMNAEQAGGPWHGYQYRILRGRIGAGGGGGGE